MPNKRSPSEHSGGLLNLRAMTWNVTYRNKSGKKDCLVVEAASRSELFEVLKKQGITPISIQGNAKVPRRKISVSKSLIKTIAIGVLLLICAAVFTFFISSRDNEVTLKPTEKPKSLNTRQNEPIKRDVATITEKESEKEPVEKPAVVTNFVNNVWYDDKGRPHYKVARTIRPGQKTIINGKPWVPEKPVFHHPVEVELDVLLSRRPGERIYGDVNWKAFERDLPAALKNQITISPDDSDDIVERKKLVMAAKKELIEAMKAGESPTEILKASRDDVNKLADIRDNLQNVIAEMRQEGASEEEIEETVKNANTLLKQYNIDNPIISPKTMRERGEAAKLRRLQRMQER